MYDSYNFETFYQERMYRMRIFHMLNSQRNAPIIKTKNAAPPCVWLVNSRYTPSCVMHIIQSRPYCQFST